MTPKQYILEELKNLKVKEAFIDDAEKLKAEILRLILSKKFRKYKAKPELIDQIKEAIRINVENQKPINVTYLHGAYKLWRLEEAPEADWGELFSAMYFVNWLKGICAIYKPGVWFEYFVDDAPVPRLNNIPMEDVETYIQSYQKVFDFLKPYLPKNFSITLTRVLDKFESLEAFHASMDKNVPKVRANNPQYTPAQYAMAELNVKPTTEQMKDPQWLEKVLIDHDAYMLTKREPGYHYVPEKILAFNAPVGSGTLLSVGTTKTSIAKFWCGVGALKKEGDRYREYILSPKQIESTKWEKEAISFESLDGKNFKSIRMLKS